jgi:hypothetical protein
MHQKQTSMSVFFIVDLRISAIPDSENLCLTIYTDKYKFVTRTTRKYRRTDMNQKKRNQNCPRGSFGKLLPNQNNRHPQSPHLVGQVEIDSNLFEELVELYDSGKALRLQVAI